MDGTENDRRETRDGTSKRMRIGISACLLGQNVRFDGGHKLDHYLKDTLGAFVDFVPVCPEVEMGLPIPREALRLTGTPKDPRLVTSRGGIDITEAMGTWAKDRLEDLERENLCGFVFKSGSPSSGMERVRVYRDNGIPSKDGVGIFARAFMDRFPLVPVEDEGRLQDPDLRENFIERIFIFSRWRDFRNGSPTLGALVEFHTAHKLQVMAHSPKHYSALGRLVAKGRDLTPAELYGTYERSLMEALGLLATAKKNANVLMHIAGYFRKQLSADERQELVETIEAFRTGLTPLLVPITLVNHYVRKYDDPYLKGQHYLHPHPLELKLRNHA
jgi:uncharacterized protein YbgA (DUF1722 family)/uncharacterized protein YbbK (DUF523 family)